MKHIIKSFILISLVFFTSCSTNEVKYKEIFKSWINPYINYSEEFKDNNLISYIVINSNQDPYLKGKIDNEIFEIKIATHYPVEGDFYIFRVSKFELGIYIESMGVTENYKVDLKNRTVLELWNPNWNAGSTVFYADWERNILFTQNVNTDKRLPEDYEYTLNLHSTHLKQSTIVDKSKGYFSFINEKNGVLTYSKRKSEDDDNPTVIEFKY